MISPRCQSVRDLLAQYVDGALAEAEARAVSEHLGLCPRCTEAELMARAIPALLANPIDPPPPPTLLPRVVSALHRVRRSERQAAAIIAASFLLAAGAALVGAAPLTEQAGFRASLLQLARLKPSISEPQLSGPARVPGREPVATPADVQLPAGPAPQSTPAAQPTSGPVGAAAPAPAAAAAPTAASRPAPAAVDTQPPQPLPAPQQPQPAPSPPAQTVLPVTVPPLTTIGPLCPVPLSPADGTAISGSSTLPDAAPAPDSSGQSVAPPPAPVCPIDTSNSPSVSAAPALASGPIAGVAPRS